MSWSKQNRRWKAEYTDTDGKSRYLALYDTQEEAARAVDAAIRTLPPDVQLRRKMNSADANGPLVPKPSGARDKKRRRDEPPAPPAAPPRKRVSAPPADHLLGYLDLAPLLRGDACLDAVAQP